MKEFTSLIRDIPDFPKPGIIFRDVTPLLKQPSVFQKAIDLMVAPFKDQQIDQVLAIEARGYLLGTPIALALGAGFVPARKAGKLPYRTYRSTYELEYGSAEIEIHQDAFEKDQRVLLVDDVLATGGTLEAAIDLVQQSGSTVAGISVLIELTALKGRSRLGNTPLFTLIQY